MNSYERLWKLEASVKKLVLEGKRDPKMVADVLQRIIDEKKTELGDPFLKLISGNEKIMIGATDGKATIAEASDVFTGDIDPSFKNYDVMSTATKQVLVQVYEMTKDGTFKQIFGSFGENLDCLCLSQSQIIKFVKEHNKWLRTDGYGTFFLFKVKEGYFVADVCLDSDGPDVSVVDRLGYDHVWGAVFGRRFVVPQ